MSKAEKINLSSLKLVQDQLVNTIERSAQQLEEFAADRHNAELLQSCIDGIKQIRGTLSLLQLRGVDVLAEELVVQITDIPLGEEQDIDQQLEVLTDAFFILPRYLEYCLQTSRSMAVLLVPHINALRQLRHAPPLPESHFFPLELEQPIAPPGSRQSSILGEDHTAVARRLRHMYQLGLVKVLQNKQIKPSLGMMGRALERLEAISGDRPLAALWWAAAACLEALRETELTINLSRKRLFSSLDREIKKLQTEGTKALEQVPPESLLRELLYLVALSRGQGKRAQQVSEAYKLEPLPYTDNELARELEFLNGPSAATIHSMGSVLQDELRSAKNMLERAAEGGAELLNEAPDLVKNLQKITDILAVVGLVSPSNSLRREVQKIQEWQKSDEDLDPQALLEVADTLLYIESTVSGMDKTALSDDSLARINRSSRDDIISNSQLLEATNLVLEEAEVGLGMTKRALTSYMESGYDIGHIKNLCVTFNTIRGGMTLLNRPRAVAVLKSCVDFIESSLLGSERPAAVESMLETFADAVIGLEYYIDTLRNEGQADDEILQIAEDSLNALGCPVS